MPRFYFDIREGGSSQEADCEWRLNGLAGLPHRRDFLRAGWGAANPERLPTPLMMASLELSSDGRGYVCAARSITLRPSAPACRAC